MKFKSTDSEVVINAYFDEFIIQTNNGPFEITSAVSTRDLSGELEPSITMHGFFLRKDGKRKATQRYSTMLRVAFVSPESYAPHADPWAWEKSVMDAMVEEAKKPEIEA